MTGGLEDDGEDRAFEAGADSFLRKPFGVTELLDLVDELLSRHRPSNKE